MSRLIDADDLIDGYKHMGYDPTEFEEESYQEGWCKGFNAAVEHCISHVIHTPTVEPQRITGRWIKTEKHGEHTLCSICGTRWDTDYVESRELYYTGKIPKFCPECGNPMEVIKNGNE